MKILVNYPGLAERLHMKMDALVEEMSDHRYFEQQQKKNPDFFIVIADNFETFFQDWRVSDGKHNIKVLEFLYQNSAAWLNTEMILGELLPLITQLNKKIDIMSEATTKLSNEVGVLVPLVESLITVVNNIQTANDELKAIKAAGKADDETVQKAVDLIDAEITNAQNALAAAGTVTAPTPEVPTNAPSNTEIATEEAPVTGS